MRPCFAQTFFTLANFVGSYIIPMKMIPEKRYFAQHVFKIILNQKKGFSLLHYLHGRVSFFRFKSVKNTYPQPTINWPGIHTRRYSGSFSVIVYTDHNTYLNVLRPSFDTEYSRISTGYQHTIVQWSSVKLLRHMAHVCKPTLCDVN